MTDLSASTMTASFKLPEFSSYGKRSGTMDERVVSVGIIEAAVRLTFMHKAKRISGASLCSTESDQPIGCGKSMRP